LWAVAAEWHPGVAAVRAAVVELPPGDPPAGLPAVGGIQPGRW
jgi:hypothetical protein